MRKMKSKKGFTLIEMLIVVGIIAVLVAVSIPMVNSSLEKAKVATDAANERAAKAAALIDYLSGKDVKGVYDAESGSIKASGADVKTTYGKCSKHKTNNVLLVEVKDGGEVAMQWAAKPAGAVDTVTAGGGDLHGINVDAPTPTGASG